MSAPLDGAKIVRDNGFAFRESVFLMKTRIPIVWLATGMLWLLPMSVVSVKADDDLAKSHCAYTNCIQAIRQDAEKKKSDLLVLYRKKLDALRQDAKKKGDFDAVQSVDKEIKRFDAQKSPPVVTNKNSSNELVHIGENLHDELDRSEMEHARQTVQLTEQYLQFLDGRVKQSVQNEKMDLAKAYKGEIGTTREAPVYQSAKFVLAEKDPQPDAPSPATPDSKAHAETPAPAANAQIAHLHVDPTGLYDATRIYEGLPPASSSSPYRQIPVVETGKAPVPGDLGISLEGYIENENTYQLRVKLRPKTSGATFQNLKMLVQYFGHNPNNNNKAQEAHVWFTMIPCVAAKNTTCEMKPADMPFNYTYHTFYGGSYTSDKKGAFAGVVVSVFSADDKLLAQNASVVTLKEFSKSAFELPPEWLDTYTPPFSGSGSSLGSGEVRHHRRTE